MFSERIKTIASLVDKNDVVLDVGCDHGYLCIYLMKNKLCLKVLSSDISKNALESAKNNFKKNNLDIKTFLSDGFNNVDENFNTAVIAGMGTHTILNILNNKKMVKKLIISSNNDWYKLRVGLNKLGYKEIYEKIVYENNHYYPIMVYIKGKEKIKKRYLKFGISKDKDYLNYLLEKNNKLIKKVPTFKRISLYYDNYLIKKLLKELG